MSADTTILYDQKKAFDLVNIRGLPKLLQQIWCPTRLLQMIRSFHENMRVTVQFDGSIQEPFSINSRVKQGCALTPMLFGIISSLLLPYVCSSLEDSIFLQMRSNGKLFNLA